MEKNEKTPVLKPEQAEKINYYQQKAEDAVNLVIQISTYAPNIQHRDAYRYGIAIMLQNEIEGNK